jgi:hypothetical protein
MYIICIEINKHRMIIYKNIGRDDLCKVKILSNASCNCGTPCENSHHFFFDGDKYTDNRGIIRIVSQNWH